MGEIFREDVQIDGICVGMKDSEMSRLATLKELQPSTLLRESLTPVWAGKKLDIFLGQFLKLSKFGTQQSKALATLPPFAAEMKSFLDITEPVNTPDFCKAEVSSCFAKGNARGLAKLASKMASKGKVLIILHTRVKKILENFQEHDFLRDLNFPLLSLVLRSREEKCGTFKYRKQSCS